MLQIILHHAGSGCARDLREQKSDEPPSLTRLAILFVAAFESGPTAAGSVRSRQ
jgi:hypothetical protein